MKTLITILFSAGAVVALLYSEITPWRIVNKADLKPVVIERRIVVPATSRTDHSGEWMHDPDYRSALERTTVVGAPEPAAHRDIGRPVATPSH